MTTHGESEVAKLFARKGPERLILPGLNVARRPVIDQADSENMFFRLGDGNGFSQPISGAYKKPNFQFIVERFGRPEFRIGIAIARLAAGTTNRCS